MADEVKPPVAIRITRPFATEDEFLEREFDTLTRTSVVLLGAQPRPQGVILRFEIVLTTGQSVLRGEGRVVAFKPVAYANEPGLVLRFTRLDSKSKELVDRAAMLRDARIRASGMPEARKSVQMPAVQVPRPPPFAQPVVSTPFSAPMSAASMPTSTNTAAPEATIAQRATSSRPPPLPPPDKGGRRTAPPPLPSSSSTSQGMAGTRASGGQSSSSRPPQPPLPPRFAELDVESTHVESMDSSALESDRVAAPPSPSPPSFDRGFSQSDQGERISQDRVSANERSVSSLPPSSEEPFKLSQPRISSLPSRPPSIPPQEPFALDPGAARALEAGNSSPFVPPPIFVPPPAAPLPYMPETPSFELIEEDVSMDDSVELSPAPPVPSAPLSGPTYGQVFDPISVTSLDAAVPISFDEDEPMTNVDPEPEPLPPLPPLLSLARLDDPHEAPPLPLMPFPPLPVAAQPLDSPRAGIANGHATRDARHAGSDKGSPIAPPADRDALLERLRGRARALPAERVTAILAKRV